MATPDKNARLTPSAPVRIAEREDAERIKTLINTAFRRAEAFFIDTDRVDLDSVLNYLSIGKFLIAERENELLGCVYVEPRDGDERRAYLGLLAVDPSCQQAGLGSVLMNAAEDYCRGLSCRHMDIKIVNLRGELPAFYGKRGYVATGRSSFPTDLETKVPVHFIDMTKLL
jgi:N-acetylglutamate synthase-like GNAT family acetyltransferase